MYTLFRKVKNRTAAFYLSTFLLYYYVLFSMPHVSFLLFYLAYALFYFPTFLLLEFTPSFSTLRGGGGRERRGGGDEQVHPELKG